MMEWIELKPRKLNQRRIQNFNGVEVEVFLSPYDVPDAMRGEIDPETNNFIVRFRYMGCDEPQEKLERKRSQDHVWLHLGRNTGRLYAVEADLKALNTNAIQLAMQIPDALEGAIDWLSANTTSRSARQGNYSVAKRAMASQKDRLYRELVPQG